MKKVLFVAATLGGGGAERVMLNLANKMKEKGLEVVVLKTADEKNPHATYGLNPEITIEKIGSKHTGKLLRVIDKFTQFRKLFRMYSEYTIISFLPDVNIYSIAASRGLGNRVIVSERNDPAREPSSRFVRILRDYFYKFADYIVFQTKDAQRCFCKRIRDKSGIIPNPLDLDQLPQPEIDCEKRDAIIMVCRVKPQKNIGMMIDAVSKIDNQMGSTTVEIYGDGNLYRNNMQKRISELGLDSRIKFMGPSREIYSIMKTAKIYVSTSDYEGISNTMLEALALGVPTIVTDCPIGGARMFVENNVNGILVPVGDSDALARELLRLLNDTELQRTFSNNSILIRNELDLNLIADKWIDIV